MKTFAASLLCMVLAVVVYGQGISQPAEKKDTGKAIVELKPPRDMRPWSGDRYRWDATFRETGGKSGFKLRATDFYVLSTNGTKWSNSWGPSVEVKAGGSADVHWWVDKSEKWAGGKFHCIWVGQDDTGASIRIEQWANIP